MANLSGKACAIPNLRVHPKVHKPTLPNGDPHTRPLVGATSGPTVRSGDILSRILDAVAMAKTSQSEVLSTEELLAELEDVTPRIRSHSRRAVLGSIDVRALFPSLRIKEAAAICARQVRESPITFQGVDYRAATLFLATHPPPIWSNYFISGEKIRFFENFLNF